MMDHEFQRTHKSVVRSWGMGKDNLRKGGTQMCMRVRVLG
jgi:hypothetical protein